MRTIKYTYDDEHPSNRDYLIAALAEEIDDGGASHESVARYHLECPYYYGGNNCLNEHEQNQYGTADYRQGCVRCKMSWLLREFDTYPSDDGRWEIDEV